MSERRRRRSRPVFRARTAIALVLVGVFAFSAFVTLAAFAPDLQRDLRCRANAYSTCAVGFAGLAALVKQGGAPAGDQPPGHARRPRRGAVHRHPGGRRQESDIAKLGFSRADRWWCCRSGTPRSTRRT